MTFYHTHYHYYIFVVIFVTTVHTKYRCYRYIIPHIYTPTNTAVYYNIVSTNNTMCITVNITVGIPLKL